MSRFMYRSRDAQGELVTGVVQAATVEEAGRMLRGEGKVVVNLEPAEDGGNTTQRSPALIGGGVKRQQVITFVHQLAVMLETGVPLSEALHCILEQVEHEAFRAVLEDVTQHVQAGGQLSAALARHPQVFPHIMLSLIRASEASGTMGTMLERVSRYLAYEQAILKKVRGAMTYPAIVFVLVIAVTLFLLTFVLPQFTELYATRGAALPGPTRALMSVSDALLGYWYAWVAGAAGLGLLFVFGRRTVTGRRVIDYAKLNTPLFDRLFTKLYIARACRTMGIMLNAGVPILEMIAVVKQVTRNVYYEELWDAVDERLRQGSQLSDAMLSSPLVPRAVGQMIHSGEKAGRLSQVVERIAEYTEEEFDQQVKQTTQFIEPALVCVMGGIIGFVAIALLLPILSASQVVAG